MYLQNAFWSGGHQGGCDNTVYNDIQQQTMDYEKQWKYAGSTVSVDIYYAGQFSCAITLCNMSNCASMQLDERGM